MTLSYHKGLVPQKWSSFCNTHSFTNPNWPTLDLCIQTQNWPNHWAAAAKLLQSCPTLCNPIDGSPPGSLSLGFSRQEHWSGLPFPSPVHESEKWKWSRSVVSDSLRPHGLQPTRLLHPWDFPGKRTGLGCHCLLHCKLYCYIKGVLFFLSILTLVCPLISSSFDFQMR